MPDNCNCRSAEERAKQDELIECLAGWRWSWGGRSIGTGGWKPLQPDHRYRPSLRNFFHEDERFFALFPSILEEDQRIRRQFPAVRIEVAAHHPRRRTATRKLDDVSPFDGPRVRGSATGDHPTATPCLSSRGTSTPRGSARSQMASAASPSSPSSLARHTAYAISLPVSLTRSAVGSRTSSSARS